MEELSRRRVMALALRGGMAMVLLGACSTSDEGTTEDGESTPPEGDTDAWTWHRTDLGFVSAYVLVRRGEAVVVDTGVTGSEDAIRATLEQAGVSYDDVSDVIITHRHDDHLGSVAAIADLAPDATVHAGADDVVMVPLDGVMPLVGGDRVAGLDIIATPGHTPGHISVHDPATRLLVAGDALNGNAEGTAVLGPNADFTPDMTEAEASVRVLAALDVDTILFGHGAPAEGGAGVLLRGLAG